jgi:hypothetical protein
MAMRQRLEGLPRIQTRGSYYRFISLNRLDGSPTMNGRLKHVLSPEAEPGTAGRPCIVGGARTCMPERPAYASAVQGARGALLGFQFAGREQSKFEMAEQNVPGPRAETAKAPLDGAIDAGSSEAISCQ